MDNIIAITYDFDKLKQVTDNEKTSTLPIFGIASMRLVGVCVAALTH